MASGTARRQWVLEVVRGRTVGGRLALNEGESLLGNDLAGAPGISLADQEQPGSPRRMAPRHASVSLQGDVLEIRDLESPGGTFVNRQRLLSGQARSLQPGDLIQLGGVQLRVVCETNAAPAVQPPPPPVRTGPAASSSGQLSIPYTIAGGGVCRTWDDFLTLSAQRWALVRDELTSGRIAEHLKRARRFDLAPRPIPGKSPDEQLDAWLERLPASRSSAPELDVHPENLIVRASSAGGLVRLKIQITNVGYRLLRGTVRVESPVPGRIRIVGGSGAASFVAIDQTELQVEVELGDGGAGSPSGATLGAVVIDGNGGTKRVEVRLERPERPRLIPDATTGAPPIDLRTWSRPLGERISALPIGRRLVLALLAMMGFRMLLALSALVPGPLGQAASPGGPRLDALALVLGVLGMFAGAAWARRNSEGRALETGRDMASAGFAGAMLGLFLSAVGFAFIQSVESVLGSWSSSTPAAVLLWGVLGLALAGLSWIILPSPEGSSRPGTELTS